MSHQIRMTAPGVTLGKQDVVFEVVIDGEKRGELLLSQGDLRWRPRSSKYAKGTRHVGGVRGLDGVLSGAV